MKRQLHPCIYIMTNPYNTVLYTGVASNLLRRVTEHKDKTVVGFTSKYNVMKLVHYEWIQHNGRSHRPRETDQRWFKTEEDRFDQK